MHTLQQAQALISQDPARVEPLLSPYLAQIPGASDLLRNNHATGHKLIAQSQLALQHPEAALIQARHGQALQARQTVLASELGLLASQALWALGQRDDARDELAELASILSNTSSPLSSELYQRTLLQLSQWQQADGNLAEATITANLAVNSAENWRNTEMQLAALDRWSELLQEQKLYQAALEQRLAHQRIARQTERRELLADSLYQESRLRFLLGQIPASEASAQAAAELAESQGQPLQLVRALMQLGQLAMVKNQPEFALVHFFNGLEYAAALSQVERGRLHSWISAACAIKGCQDRAEDFAKRALRLYQDQPDATATNRVAAHAILASVYLNQQRLQEGAVQLQLAAREQARVPIWLQNNLIGLSAQLAHLRGNDAEAYQVLKQKRIQPFPQQSSADLDTPQLLASYRMAFDNLEGLLLPPATSEPKWSIGLIPGLLLILTATLASYAMIRHHRNRQGELDQLRHDLTHDKASGLLNVQGLSQQLQQRFNQAKQLQEQWYSGDLPTLPAYARYTVAVFRLECIDHLIHARGFPFCDRFERALGLHLRRGLKDSEMIGRTQGNMFCFVTPCGTESEPGEAARRIRELTRSFSYEGHQLEQKLAIGLVSYPVYPSATNAVSHDHMRNFLVYARARAEQQRDEMSLDICCYLRPLDCFPGDLFLDDPDNNCQHAIDRGYLRLEKSVLD